MSPRALPPIAQRAAAWLIGRGARWARPLTMGVRAVILDRNRVFLVRHSYVPGWHFPGGGLEPHESAAAAMRREVREEAGLVVEGEAPLHGLFFNAGMAGRDHVAVFVVRGFRPLSAPAPDWEIAERGFFALDALPAGVTAGTRARLGEVLHGDPVAEMW